MFYKLNEEPLADTMPQRSRVARQEVIQRYDHRADYLGLNQVDWEPSTFIKDGDHKFTKKNAHDLLSNTLGASKASDHRRVRAGTLHLGQHPWEGKTTCMRIDKPETSNGWELRTAMDRKLQSQIHEQLRVNAASNTRRKEERYLTNYAKPAQIFRKNMEKDRQAKLDARHQQTLPPNTGPVQVKARPRTVMADIQAVEALQFPDVPPTPDKSRTRKFAPSSKALTDAPSRSSTPARSQLASAREHTHHAARAGSAGSQEEEHEEGRRVSTRESAGGSSGRGATIKAEALEEVFPDMDNAPADSG